MGQTELLIIVLAETAGSPHCFKLISTNLGTLSLYTLCDAANKACGVTHLQFLLFSLSVGVKQDHSLLFLLSETNNPDRYCAVNLL